VVVAGVGVNGPPLHRTRLIGRDTLLVIPDESTGLPYEGRAEFARVELPGPEPAYRYRLIASIILAEVARQLGTPARPARAPRHRYESALTLTQPSDSDLVTPGELRQY
jgi:hypothetical protein